MELIAVEPLDELAARRLTDRIRLLVESINGEFERLVPLVVEAYAGRVWLAMEFESWEAYVSAEVPRIRIGRQERRELIAALAAEAQMSNRAIAPVAGVSEGTVRNDLGAQNCAPDETTSVNGRDGKAYPVRPKAKARTEPQKGEEVSEESDRQSSARRSRTNVVATVTRVVMQAQDAAYAAEDLKPEHFKQRKEEATRWARDLDKAIQSLQQLADLLKEQSE